MASKKRSTKTSGNLEKHNSAAAFENTLKFTANATNKSNELQVNSTCFEKDPPEEDITKVTVPGAAGFTFNRWKLHHR